MWLNVTQRLPEGSQLILVNTDTVERAGPWKNGIVIVFMSGASVELAETMDDWIELTQRQKGG